MFLPHSLYTAGRPPAISTLTPVNAEERVAEAGCRLARPASRHPASATRSFPHAGVEALGAEVGQHALGRREVRAAIVVVVAGAGDAIDPGEAAGGREMDAALFGVGALPGGDVAGVDEEVDAVAGGDPVAAEVLGRDPNVEHRRGRLQREELAVLRA